MKTDYFNCGLFTQVTSTARKMTFFLMICQIKVKIKKVISNHRSSGIIVFLISEWTKKNFVYNNFKICSFSFCWLTVSVW